jgi:hypothetical protein
MGFARSGNRARACLINLKAGFAKRDAGARGEGL